MAKSSTDRGAETYKIRLLAQQLAHRPLHARRAPDKGYRYILIPLPQTRDVHQRNLSARRDAR